MDISIIIEYVDMTIILSCFVVGWVVKNVIPTDAVNKYIPLLVSVLGVTLTVWENHSFSAEILAVGLVSGWASTGLYEMLKNFDFSKLFKKGE